LQNLAERAAIMPTASVLHSLTAELERQSAVSGTARTLDDADRAHIISVLRESNGVVGGRNGAAARLGLPRTTLIAKMQKLGISRNTTNRTPTPDFSMADGPSGSAAEYIAGLDADGLASLAGHPVTRADGYGNMASGTLVAKMAGRP
jgi:hypothetical protein